MVLVMSFGSRPLLFSLIALSFALHTAVAWAQPPAELKAYVMDTDKKIVGSVSLPAGTVLESPKLDKTPALMVLSPDGSRLLVFERATGYRRRDDRLDGVSTLTVAQPNSLSIFDTRDMKLVARLEKVGWNAVAHPLTIWPQAEINAAWDGSGKLLTILAWGKKGQKPEIVQLDVPKARVTGRLPLPCKTDEVMPMLQVSGDTAAVLYENQEKKGKTATHKLVLVNLTNLADSKEISGIARELARSPDGDHLFVLADDGLKIKEPGQAHLHVISAANRSLLQTIDGGFFLADALADQSSGLTLITRMGKTGTSTLFAFQRDQKKAEIEIPDVALKSKLASQTKRLYVLCYNSVQVIDLETLKLMASIPTPHRTTGFWESGSYNRPPSNLAFDSTESVGVLGYSGDDESSVLDLKDFKIKGTIDLIPGAKAFGKTMLVTAANLALDTGAYAAAANLPPATGAGIPVGTVVVVPYVPQGPSPQYWSSAVDPSGQYVYILGAGHVYVADLKTYKKLSSIPLGFSPEYAYFLSRPEGQNPLLFVVGTKVSFTVGGTPRMSVIDMKTNDNVLDQKWQGHCLYTSDRKYAVNFDSDNVYLLDGSTLSTVKTVGGFKELRQFLLAP